jgi:hypothetical protein
MAIITSNISAQGTEKPIYGTKGLQAYELPDEFVLHIDYPFRGFKDLHFISNDKGTAITVSGKDHHQQVVIGRINLPHATKPNNEIIPQVAADQDLELHIPKDKQRIYFYYLWHTQPFSYDDLANDEPHYLSPPPFPIALWDRLRSVFGR